MMKPAQSMEERLWDYIDGISSDSDRAAIEELLNDDEVWKNTYAELLEVHASLRSTEMEAPSMRFTRNVMDKIASYQTSTSINEYINKNIIRAIGVFVMLLIGGFLIYAFTNVKWTSTGSVQLPFDPGKIDLSLLFNNTTLYLFMSINVVLGLMLLDRFLRNKKMQHQRHGM